MSTTKSSTIDRTPSNRPGGPAGTLGAVASSALGRARRNAVSAAVTATSQAERWRLTASTKGRRRQRLGEL